MKSITIVWMICQLEAGWAAEERLGTNDFTLTLRRAPAAELPAAAALLVTCANPPERSVTISNVVRVAAAINPAATPMVVGAVARAFPKSAVLAAQVAVAEQPGLAATIANAAAAITPANAPDIVKAVGATVPKDLREIAIAAGSAAPAATKDILRAVGSVRPDLAPYIEAEIQACRPTVPSVARCLERAELAKSRATAGRLSAEVQPRPTSGSVRPSPAQAPPGPGGPKPPRPGGPPPGGRNYARP